MPTKKRNFIFSILASASMLLALSTGLWDYSSAAAMPMAACPAAITVSNANDSGAGSLRQALVDVCAAGTISFDESVFKSATPQTITLSSEITIGKNLTLDGPGAEVLAISGGDAIQPFTINYGVTALIQDLTIKAGQTTGHGGGIFSNGTLTVQNSTLSGNSATLMGGGIFSNGTLTVQNSTLSGNTAGQNGGGIFNTGTLTIQNSTLSGNSAGQDGGGIYNLGTLKVQNSTLSGNTASRNGGGIYNWVILKVENSTLSGNSGLAGGGIYNYSGLWNYTNTIIANSPSDDCYNSGTIGTNSHNLVEDGNCSAIYSGNPLLGTLGNYGGSTQTMKPGSGSPVIDAGSGCLATDQRGVTRGTLCDIGAFETSGVMVKTETATSISSTDVTLNGTINANDSDSLTITFNYGTTSSYGTTIAATPNTASGMGDVAVSKSLTGLTPNTTYHYRVLGTGASTGTSNGEDVTFTTSAVVPTVTTDAASSINGTGATLNGTVNANNASTTVTFEYGTTIGYGTSATASPSTATGTSSTAASAMLTGLTPNTTYHYRVVGTNSAGTTNSEDATFTTSAVVPTATTGSASSIASTGATLNGTLNANNASTTVTFEYGTSTAYGTTPSASPSLVTGTSNTPVSKALTGLTPNTTYHFRVVGVNSTGTNNGGDATFTTSAVVPTVTTDAASSIASTGATLNGTLNANNASTTVTFQYGLTSGYGASVTADQSPVTGTSDTAVSKALTGLTPNSIYHFRAVGVNSAGTTNGLDATFTTGKVAPIATTGAATDVTGTGATLNGTVNAGNDAATVTFEYGPTAAYGTSVAAMPGTVTGMSGTVVSAALTELTLNTTYHYRVVAVNSAGTTEGLDKTFTTGKVTPTATTDAATGVTGSGATLNGTVNARNDAATVTFEYGPTAAYGTSVAATPGTVTGMSGTVVSAALTGLTLNTTYHFRVVAVNSAGTTEGLDKTFTTGKVAPTATTDAATGVTGSGATLNGTVNAGNDDANVTFEYGLTDSYGTSVAATPGTVTGTSETVVSTALTGLTLNTTYHYRVVAVNSAGTSEGLDETFTTTSVTITSEIHDAKHKLILSAAIGDSLHASATVTGNAVSTPTGTLRFTTFDNTSCTGSGLSAGTVTLDGSGQAHPSTIQTLSANGRAFKAHYNGDAIYSAAEGECKAISNSPYPTVLVLASSTVPADGTELKLGPTQLLVQFNQEMWHNSAADPHAVQNPQNYLLVEAGRNQVFDTLACGPVGVGGLKPDDHVVKVDSVTYDAVTFKATLKINGGQKLPNGSYRLFICGTTSIADATDQEFLNNHLKDSLVSFSVIPASSSRKKLPKTGFAPYIVSRLPVQPAGLEYSQSGMWLEIRKLDVQLPVVGVPQQTGWDVTWLGNQAGYLEGTAFPTRNGNSVITGHVTGADGQPGAFAGLSGLAWGDEVVIHAWGQRYIFAVRSVDDTINPEDTRLLDQHEVLPWITLLTCRGYDEQSDSYRWRTAVRAVLVSVLDEDGP